MFSKRREGGDKNRLRLEKGESREKARLEFRLPVRVMGSIWGLS